MGEAADMIYEGIVCQECMCFIEDGMACGHPRSCSDCDGEKKPHAAKKSRCPECGKRFKTQQGVNDHRRVVHGKAGE